MAACCGRCRPGPRRRASSCAPPTRHSSTSAARSTSPTARPSWPGPSSCSAGPADALALVDDAQRRLGDEPRLETAHTTLVRARALLALGRRDEAVARLPGRGGRRWPGSGWPATPPAAWRELADAFARLGLLEDAALAYQQALTDAGVRAGARRRLRRGVRPVAAPLSPGSVGRVRALGQASVPAARRRPRPVGRRGCGGGCGCAAACARRSAVTGCPPEPVPSGPAATVSPPLRPASAATAAAAGSTLGCRGARRNRRSARPPLRSGRGPRPGAARSRRGPRPPRPPGRPGCAGARQHAGRPRAGCSSSS